MKRVNNPAAFYTFKIHLQNIKKADEGEPGEKMAYPAGVIHNMPDITKKELPIVMLNIERIIIDLQKAINLIQ